MRIARILTLMSLLAVMTACVPSLNPLYTDRDVVFDESLVGQWECADDDGNSRTWTFTKSEGNSYTLVDLERGEPASFEAKLVKLGDKLYLNIQLVEVPVENDMFRSLVVCTHLFARITLDGDVMSLEMMDPGWLKNRLAAKEATLDHQKLADGTLLLTGSTEQLQEFIRQHQDDKGVFSDPQVFQRRAR